MKHGKIVKLVENVNVFEEAWEAAQIIYDSRSHDFEFIKKKNEWLCRVLKVTKKVVGKETKYSYSVVNKESGSTMTEAFKLAALKYLIK